MEALIVFSQQTIKPGEQGHCRQNTTAPLRDESMCFHSLIGRNVTRSQTGWLGAQFGEESYWIPPSGWQTAQRMALSSPVTPVDLPSRRSFRGSGRKGHRLPFQAQRFSEDSRPAAAFRGSSKWVAHHALARLLFTLSGILLRRDNNCLSQGHRLDGQWLALDQQILFFTIYQLSKSCF